MNYFKTTAMLKQVENGFSIGGKEISCLIRIEIESGVARVFLSAVNLSCADSGEYYLYFIGEDGKLYAFNLGVRVNAFSATFLDIPNCQKAFSAGLVLIKDFIPLTLAFCKQGENAFNFTAFKKAVAERCLKNLKDSQKNAPLYDDEAVATENYFELDDEINQKLAIIGDKNETLSNENATTDDIRPEEEKKERQNLSAFQNETDAEPCAQPERDKTPINLEELDKIFSSFPEDFSLKGSIPNSNWVKINYDAEKFYVVGKVSQNGELKYVCYGVPTDRRDIPPKEFRGLCSFIPLSVFDLNGKGFWMIFQDALSGDCIKPN